MLKGMGLSLADYAVVTLALALASVVMCLVVSTLIIWRGPDNRIALIVALMLVTLGPIIVVADPPAASPWWVPNACLTFLTGFLLVLVFLLFPSGQFVPHWMRWTLVVFRVGDTSSLPLFLPLSFGFAILRSRLWDIDVLINRTLVYGTLTVTLTAVYVGLVIGLQTLLRGLISQDNSVAIVLSTLVIAALFQPLRHGIQRSIDRRFYRRKYDSAKIVAAFSATLRNEVDLDLLREQLMTVVQETMQPSHFSLWLRPPEPSRKRQTWLLARNASRNIKF